MKYIRVEWKHADPNTPIVLYSELDDGRMEVRKIEIFNDGIIGYASADSRKGDTMLGLVPVPELVIIAKDSQFAPIEITQGEFEAMWSRRDSRGELRGDQ